MNKRVIEKLCDREKDLLSEPDRQKSKNTPYKKPVTRSNWIRDIRFDGNLLYLAFCIEFTDNLCIGFKGSFDDRDVFAPVASLMSWEKLQELFEECTTKRVRTEMERDEYGRIRKPGR